MAHIWIVGRYTHERAAAAAEIGLPELVRPINAHRRHRGPYTMAGTLIRELAPQLLEHSADLMHRHQIEVLSITPELRDVLPASPQTLTSLAIPQERTRFYSRVRTLRLSHGVTELLRDHLRRTGNFGGILVIDGVDDADPTDVELLTVALRRLDPRLLTLVICSGGDDLSDDFRTALSRYALRRDAPGLTRPATVHADLARAYVESDCASDDPSLSAAYIALEEIDRQRLHRERAAQLEATGEFSWTLGALPYHLVRAGDPTVEGAKALLAALNYCVDMGFYHATEEIGRTGRSLINRADHESLWWAFTTKMTTSLSALGRSGEAEALYDEARAVSVNPLVHRQSAYATAMIYTRHHAPENRDHVRARAWINQAIVIATLLGENNGQGFPLVFQQNGLALIEMHLGNLPGALELVTAGLERLDRELGADEHLLHRSVLLHNRAQVLSGLGRPDEALADLDRVIAADPNYAEYHFDRGNLLHRLGRDDEAITEYTTAIRLSPPFPEAHYNRADVLTGLGDVTGALRDLDYVLELEPTNVDAYVNRAGLLAVLGEQEALIQDLDAGLALEADNPHLLALLGQAYAESGRTAEAADAYDRALARTPDLVGALAGRASLAFDAGDWAAALEWLDRALAGEDTAALRYNRAEVHQALGDHDRALADLYRALVLDPEDTDVRRKLDAYTERALPVVG